MRRVLIIIASIIFLAGLAIGVYYFFFAPGAAKLTVGENPFGTASDFVPNENDEFGNGEILTQAGEEVAPRLIRITDQPVARGIAAVALPSQAPGATGTSTEPSAGTPGDIEVRYIDRASGNVYAYRVHERTLTRIGNRTLPGIQDAAWQSDGSVAYVRYLVSGEGERIETYALPANGAAGFALETGLSQVSVSGTTSILTLLPSTSGSIATVARTDGSSPRTLFSSALSSLKVYLSNGPFIAATKASAGLDGYAFAVAANGTFSRIIGPYRGLSVLPNAQGTSVLFTYNDRGTLRTAILAMSDRSVTTIPLATLAEKCVWAPDGISAYCAAPRAFFGTPPDDWYQGVVSYSDRIWRVDMLERVVTLVVDPKSVGSVDIDIVAPAIDARGDTLTFMNKVDGSLWNYDL